MEVSPAEDDSDGESDVAPPPQSSRGGRRPDYRDGEGWPAAPRNASSRGQTFDFA